MPYIKEEDRVRWKEAGLGELLEYIEYHASPLAGDLNYIITKILLEALGTCPNYARFNEIIGVLECCKLEMYRRRVAPYEDTKIKENGDVE